MARRGWEGYADTVARSGGEARGTGGWWDRRFLTAHGTLI